MNEILCAASMKVRTPLLYLSEYDVAMAVEFYLNEEMLKRSVSVVKLGKDCSVTVRGMDNICWFIELTAAQLKQAVEYYLTGKFLLHPCKVTAPIETGKDGYFYGFYVDFTPGEDDED